MKISQLHMFSMGASASSFCLSLILTTMIISATISSIYAQRQSISGCIAAERAALFSFKEGITRDPLNLLGSWKGQDCCQWSGVQCSNRTGHVIKLSLRNVFFFDYLYSPWLFPLGVLDPQGLHGQISSSLLALQHLNHLDLSGNYLGGAGVPIPKFLGSLKSLTYLNLSSNNFDGRVPPQLGNLSRLLYLDIDNTWNSDNNVLHSKDISWLPRLPLLRYLDMSGVNLSIAGDWVQVVNQLPSLRVLRLRECHLTFRHVPVVVQSNISSLQVLDLMDNGIDTLNPSYWFWDVHTIKHLNLVNNEIAGPFPDAIGNMTSLEELGLGGNYLSSVNSETLKNLCNLKVLKLRSNRINQDLAEFMKGLPHCAESKLESLDLSVTNLTGEIPNWIKQWTNLSILQLSGNRLAGSIPLEIGKLSKITKLYLDNNEFNGSITEEHLASLVNLKELDLSYNSLQMMISKNWVPPFSLQVAYFPRCKMGPHFPLWLKGQMKVVDLDISDAGIVDSLPDWFWTVFSNVQYLNISCNQISGRLPKTLQFMSSALIFDLNSNKLTGLLPQLPKNMGALDISRNSLSGPLPQNFGAPLISVLVLAQNNISGTIPAYICQLQNLEVLDLSKNHIIGQLPKCSRGSDTKQGLNMSMDFPSMILSALILHNNNLSGKFPAFLQNCPNLILLDLAYNKFAGEFPAWIAEKLPILSYLRLRSNMFSGTISVHVTELGHLQYLDLAYNNISGTIPHALGNLKAMTQDHGTTFGNPLAWGYGRPESPDIDDPVKYDDSLPAVVKGQDLDYTSVVLYMVGLDLSCNSLVGEIPDEIASLVGLKSLNFCHNHLTGKIPEKIGLLGSLESLDLSFNELSGEIPSTLSNIASLSYLNMSYNNLSGRIPSGNQLQTLTNPASIYIGNDYLCGPPLSKNCSGPEVTTGHLEGHQTEKIYFYLGLAVGYVIGIWMVFFIFLFVKTWRLAFFHQFDKLQKSMKKHLWP